MKASRARYGVIAFAISLAVLSYIQPVAISQAAGPISHDLGVETLTRYIQERAKEETLEE